MAKLGLGLYALLAACCLLFLSRSVDGFLPVGTPTCKHAATRVRSSRQALSMGIDVSGLQMAPLPPEDLAALASSASVSTDSAGNTDLLVIQNLLIIVSGLGYLVYEGRPRGGARSEVLEIRRSTIPGANLGVFASRLIPQGTVLGGFPGYVKKTDAALRSKANDKAVQAAKKYMWALSDDTVLDPTNAQGTLELEISAFGGLVKIDTMMARINEPPADGDCNVYTKTLGTSVQVFAERDIFPNEELFMDYGQTFDRADYTPEEEMRKEREAEQRTRATKEQQDQDFMRLQPIVQSDDADPSTASIGTDTSNPDGFINRLAKNEAKFKKAGIISPEEGAELFAELGTRGLVASKEDRELLQSISGKGGVDGGSKPSTRPGSAEDVADFDATLGRGMMDSLLGGKPRGSGGKGASSNSDAELMEGLRKQMGKDEEDAPDLFDTGFFGQNSKTNSRPSAPSKSQSQARSSAIPAAPEEVKPLLSQQEAEELQSRLDNLTDEQIEDVFARLRLSLGDKMKDDLGKAIESTKVNKGLKSMPRASSVDPAVRSKYASELTAIEDELEKIYSDPLGVWQELMKNPEKYGGISEDENLTLKEGDEEFQ